MNRQELVTKLNIVSRALAQNNLVPVFQCLAFTGDSVIAFDDSLAIVAPHKTPSPVVVDGKVLMGLLTNCASEEVEFLTKDEDLNIKAGKSTFKLPWQPVEDYLFTEPEEIEPFMFLDLTPELMGGLQACLMIASDDLAQSAWAGVCIRGTGKNVCMYSTNGDAIARYIGGKFPHPTGMDFMLPSSFCQNLMKVMTDTFAVNNDGLRVATGKLELGKEWAKATLDSGYALYGRLLEVEPIPYEDEIKASLKNKLTPVKLPDGFDTALSRARVVSDPVSAPTLLTVKGGRLLMHTESTLGVVDDDLAFGGHRAVMGKVSAELVQRCAKMAHHMGISENCCVFSTDELLVLLSNMD